MRSRIRLAVAAFAIAGFAIALYVLTRPPAAQTRVLAAPDPRGSRPLDPAALAPAVDARTPTTDSAARTNRENILDGIRDPHPDHESWNEAGLALVDQLGRDAVDVADRGCYMAGCVGTFTFASEAAYRHAVDALTASTDYAAWTGGKQLTAPETLANGQVVVALVLQRPD